MPKMMMAEMRNGGAVVFVSFQKKMYYVIKKEKGKMVNIHIK